MYHVFRYLKGKEGDLYVRLRNELGTFYDFASKVLVHSDVSTCRIFFREVEDPDDPWDNIYEVDIPVPLVGAWEGEVVDINTGIVIGDGIIYVTATYTCTISDALKDAPVNHMLDNVKKTTVLQHVQKVTPFSNNKREVLPQLQGVSL